MSIVHIGIGSNLGDREGNCRKAIELLKGKGVNILKVSSMYETRPWGIKEQPDFINMAVEVETILAPHKLLELLKEIGKKMGRKKTLRWGPRVIDLDILLWGDLIVKEAGLEIPHPRMHERRFVLAPLFEIAPDARHPVTGKTIRELYDSLKTAQ